MYKRSMNRRPRLLHLQCYMVSRGRTLKNPHFSKRVGDVAPGLVVYHWFYQTFHAWIEVIEWMGEIKYGLIGAARGAFTS